MAQSYVWQFTTAAYRTLATAGETSSAQALTAEAGAPNVLFRDGFETDTYMNWDDRHFESDDLSLPGGKRDVGFVNGYKDRAIQWTTPQTSTIHGEVLRNKWKGIAWPLGTTEYYGYRFRARTPYTANTNQALICQSFVPGIMFSSFSFNFGTNLTINLNAGKALQGSGYNHAEGFTIFRHTIDTVQADSWHEVIVKVTYQTEYDNGGALKVWERMAGETTWTVKYDNLVNHSSRPLGIPTLQWGERTASEDIDATGWNILNSSWQTVNDHLGVYVGSAAIPDLTVEWDAHIIADSFEDAEASLETTYSGSVFPTAGVLDTFAGTGALSGSWAGVSGLERSSDQLRGTGTGENTGYWNTNFGPGLEATVTLPVLPPQSTSHYLNIELPAKISPNDYMRVQLKWEAAKGAYRAYFAKVTGGSITTVGTSMTSYFHGLTAGDSVGAAYRDGVLFAFHKPAAGSWKYVGSHRDTQYMAVSGKVRLVLGGQTIRVDNFAAGTIT